MLSLLSSPRIHGAFVFPAPQTMQPQGAAASSLSMSGRQTWMFCPERPLGGSSCSWRLWHVWYVGRDWDPAGLGSRDAPSRLMPLPSFQKIPGTQINEENAEILGRLVCDLGGEYIRSSGGSLLKDLSQCGSFLPDQEEAIRDVISSGNTTFGYGFFSWTSPNCSLNQTHRPTKT